MTGRRLYDALTDAWALQQNWARSTDANGLLKSKPPAWAFLTSQERRTLSKAASSLTPRRKR